jgi:YesN/AraC family two-component response regulator
VLADMVMPKVSGKDAVEAIRLLKPSVKVLYISGYTDDIIHKQGIRDETVNFISKPVSGSDLLLKIRSILDAADG